MLVTHYRALNINLEPKHILGQSAFSLAFVKKSKMVLDLFMTTPGFAWKKSSNGEHIVGAIDVNSQKNDHHTKIHNH